MYTWTMHASSAPTSYYQLATWMHWLGLSVEHVHGSIVVSDALVPAAHHTCSQCHTVAIMQPNTMVSAASNSWSQALVSTSASSS